MLRRRDRSEEMLGASSWPGLALPKIDARKSSPDDADDSKADQGTEEDLQRLAEGYLALRGIPYLHIPGGMLDWIAREGPQWMRVFVSRKWLGVPDLMIFRKDSSVGNACLMIELKSATGRMSHGQRVWASRLNVHTMRSWKFVKQQIDDFVATEGDR